MARLRLGARGIGGAASSYVAPAEGFLSGLERGVGLYKSLVEEPERQRREEERREEDRQWELKRRRWFEEDRERTIQERNQAAVDRAEREAIDAEQAAVAQEHKTLMDKLKLLSESANSAINMYGEAVPEELKRQLGTEFAQWQQRFQSVQARMQAIANQKQNIARRALERLRNAKSPQEASPADLADAIEGVGISLSEVLRGPNGEPSPFETALRKAAEAIQSDDKSGAIDAANVLLRRDLLRGVGETGPDGTAIVSKEIIALIPHPDNPKLVSPALRVRTIGNPQGYIAPVTERRSADKDDVPKWIDLDQLLEHGAKISSLVSAVNDPDVAARLRDEASKRQGQLDPALLFAQIPGITSDLLKQKTRADVAKTQAEARRDVADAQQRGATQRAQIEAQARVDAATARAGGAGGRGAGIGGAAQRPPQSMTKDQVLALLKERAREYGLTYDEKAKQWYQTDEKGRRIPASPDSMKIISRLEAEIVSRTVQGRQGAPLPALSRNPHENEVGKLYVAPNGQTVRVVEPGVYEVVTTR